MRPPLSPNLARPVKSAAKAPEDVLISLTKERELSRFAKQVELENQRAEFALARDGLTSKKRR